MSDRLISIIIPVYNESGTVGSLIENLKKLNSRCEIIVVDGGSTDDTVKIIKSHFPVLHSPQKGRSFQMNFGAKAAKGGVLFFLHADSTLQENAAEKIFEILDRGHKAGCFRIRFNSKSILMSICALMSNFRVSCRNIAFGDQGIFIESGYFRELGGFRPIPLMEDYQLSMDIKADGQKFGLADAVITTSERRFLKGGRLKTMWRMQKLQHMYRKGADIELISSLYNK